MEVKRKVSAPVFQLAAVKVVTEQKPNAAEADRDLLASMPGVGPQTASTVLTELTPVDRVPSAQSAAAYCGLSPREFSSGSSVRGRTPLSGAGNRRLRKALFLPAQAAVRFNPQVRALYARLVAAGEPKMSAVGACMRKLVMICYGVLKRRTPFDPAHPGPARAAGGSAGHPVAGRPELTPAP